MPEHSKAPNCSDHLHAAGGSAKLALQGSAENARMFASLKKVSQGLANATPSYACIESCCRCSNPCFISARVTVIGMLVGQALTAGLSPFFSALPKLQPRIRTPLLPPSLTPRLQLQDATKCPNERGTPICTPLCCWLAVCGWLGSSFFWLPVTTRECCETPYP